MKRLITLISTFVVLIHFAMAQNTKLTDIPDFDYPQTVAKNADQKLSIALNKGNGADVVRYLVQSSLAKRLGTYPVCL